MFSTLSDLKYDDRKNKRRKWLLLFLVLLWGDHFVLRRRLAQYLFLSFPTHQPFHISSKHAVIFRARMWEIQYVHSPSLWECTISVSLWELYTVSCPCCNIKVIISKIFIEIHVWLVTIAEWGNTMVTEPRAHWWKPLHLHHYGLAVRNDFCRKKSQAELTQQTRV